MARIRLPHGYNGRLVHNQGIPAGEYDSEDPRLHGHALYMVTHGFGVVVDGTLEDESALPQVATEAAQVPLELPDSTPETTAPHVDTSKRAKRR